MCSRYKLDADSRQIREAFHARATAHSPALWDDAYPQRQMPIIIQRSEYSANKEDRTIYDGIWGLHPPQFAWGTKEQKDFYKKYATFNARTEGLRESRLYGKVWERGQRCVIPLTSFFEWIEVEGKKRQVEIIPNEMVAVAGIYSGTLLRGNIPSYSMITCEPNKFMKEIHDRMPVIIDDFEKWLSPLVTPEEAYGMLKPYAGELALG